jgi:predicted O-linked N-acetylglucosamine transferase (SPINDLY family)
MNWLTRVFRTGNAPAPAADTDGPEEWLRAGYDCECRADSAGAERFYRRVLDSDPTHTDALYFLGRLSVRDRREEEAIALFQRAVEIRPQEALYLLALAEALFATRRFAESIDLHRAFLALVPNCTGMRNNYAAALIEQNRREEARVELEQLRALLPDVDMVHFNLAGIYREYGRADESVASYRRFLELTPGHAPAWSNLLLQLNYSATLGAPAIFADHQRFGELFARRFQAPVPDRAWPRRLRIGYLSPDFREHVVMRFFEPILANHDKQRFEVFLYHSHRLKDALSEKLRAQCASWLDCEDLSDIELADRIREDRIDILVDLAGHTSGNRLPVFAMKPAPVQATYLGYPNTTGLGAVDYRITDAYADPPGESDRLSSERLVRLPGSYFCYRPASETPAVGSLPSLASGHVTFGCFNNFAKLSGDFLDAAARVLAAVPGSRLVLKSRPLAIPAVADPIRRRFEHSGIDPGRVEMRGWEPAKKDHLAIYGAIDIALDSFPYNGATTTCEALWMGVPVVSLVGDRHAGRAGSSLLNAMELGEFVARDVGDYVAICARLAGDRARLLDLRLHLRERLQKSPLMDEAGFTRRLERCYVELWEARPGEDRALRVSGAGAGAEILTQARLLREAGRFKEARAACEKILAGRPESVEALTLLWDMSFDDGAPGAAIDWLNKAIAADGGVASFHYMLGCALQAQGKVGDAIVSLRQALSLDPAQAKTHNNLGCMLEAAGDLGGAAECYRCAIRFDPGMAQALYNLGNVHRQLGDVKEAIKHIEQALAIEPRHADWRCNLGDLHYVLLQLDDAIANYRAAVEIDPNYGRAYADLGGVLLIAGRVEEGMAAFDKVLELNPGRADVGSLSLLALHYRQGNEAPMQFEKHRSWARQHARGLERATAHRSLARPMGRRLRLGYVSPDFMHCPVASFIEPVLAAHDRREFELVCYSSGGQEDEVTRRLRGLCDVWRDISLTSEQSAADRIRADGIDILVDLAGHTAAGRLLLFARKPAPVQVTWLGYPNTTGLDTMDYRLTDAVADPEGETDRFHTERLVRLPAGCLCYAPSPESPEVADAPQLKTGHVTFGCFNSLAKVTPELVALWSEILRAQPGARLMLKAYGLSADSACRDLRQRFGGHGIAPQRVDLCVPESSAAGHLARYREIDIGLDTFPYNDTTATCEALWMGVPVVTLAGSTHASRIGASILSSVGLPEHIATTSAQYVAIALRLAAEPEKRRTLRAGQRARMRTSPLLDAPQFARSLEAAYREMWEKRHASGTG